MSKTQQYPKFVTYSYGWLHQKKQVQLYSMNITNYSYFLSINEIQSASREQWKRWNNSKQRREKKQDEIKDATDERDT